HRAADVREVDARARAPAEDHALLGVPLEDRLHRVLHAEDEAVVNSHVVREVLARLRLNVVDLHFAKILDRDNLLLAQVRATLGVAQLERAQHLLRLLTAYEADHLGEARTLGADGDRHLVHVMAVLALLRLVAPSRIDTEHAEKDLHVLGPALADDRESDAGVLVAILTNSHIAVCLEEAAQVGHDLVVRGGEE